MMDAQSRAPEGLKSGSVSVLETPKGLQECREGARPSAVPLGACSRPEMAVPRDEVRRLLDQLKQERLGRGLDRQQVAAEKERWSQEKGGLEEEIRRLLEDLEQERLERRIDRRSFIAECERWQEEKNRMPQGREPLPGQHEILLQERRQIALKLRRAAAERDRIAIEKAEIAAERDQIGAERDRIVVERDQMREEQENRLARLSAEGEALRTRLLQVEQTEQELRSLLAQVTAALQVEKQRNANPFAPVAALLGLPEGDEEGERAESGWNAAGFWAFTLGLGTLIIFAVAYSFTWMH